jgi:hypothetical protein
MFVIKLYGDQRPGEGIGTTCKQIHQIQYIKLRRELFKIKPNFCCLDYYRGCDETGQ